MLMLSNAIHNSGFPQRMLERGSRFAPARGALLPSSGSDTLIALLNLTFARMCKEYLSKSGIDLVRPLKLGRNMEMRGPLSFGSSGSFSSHNF